MKIDGISTTVILATILFLSQGCGGQATPEDEVNQHILRQMGTPIFWAEGHPGSLDRESWQIEVSGLCENPQTLSWNDLMSMSESTADARLTSVTRWSVRGNWTGVRLSDVLDRVGMKPGVKFIRFWSVGRDYDTSIPVDIAQKERTLLAWAYDGEYLTEDYGGPVRVFCPYLWGYKSAKSVVAIELMDHYEPGFWERRGYTDSGEIEAGPMRDINRDGEIRPIPGGEVKRFLDE